MSILQIRDKNWGSGEKFGGIFIPYFGKKQQINKLNDYSL